MLWNNKKGFYDSKVQATFKSLELLLLKSILTNYGENDIETDELFMGKIESKLNFSFKTKYLFIPY
jgi:hypothetical protein